MSCIFIICTRWTGWTWSAHCRPTRGNFKDRPFTIELAEDLPGLFLRSSETAKELCRSGQLGIFANGYWGHPAYKLPKEVNLIGVAHYLEALEWQKEIVKIHAIFGGKNPHPNYLVGGVPCSFNLDEVNAINTEKLNLVGKLIKDAVEFRRTGLYSRPDGDRRLL